MKTDLYTKVVLTIIAVALSINVLQHADLIPEAQANNQPGPEPIPNVMPAVMDVNIKSIDTYDEMPVKIKDIDTYDVLRVNLKEIETNDELDVNIDEIGGTSTNFSNGVLDVRIKD